MQKKNKTKDNTGAARIKTKMFSGIEIKSEQI